MMQGNRRIADTHQGVCPGITKLLHATDPKWRQGVALGVSVLLRTAIYTSLLILGTNILAIWAYP